MLAIERYSKFVVVPALPNKASRNVALPFATGVLSHFGAPAEVLTDQGSEFQGEFEQLLLRFGFQWSPCTRQSTPSWGGGPQTQQRNHGHQQWWAISQSNPCSLVSSVILTPARVAAGHQATGCWVCSPDRTSSETHMPGNIAGQTRPPKQPPCVSKSLLDARVSSPCSIMHCTQACRKQPWCVRYIQAVSTPHCAIGALNRGYPCPYMCVGQPALLIKQICIGGIRGAALLQDAGEVRRRQR
jgi:hypothetical protein